MVICGFSATSAGNRLLAAGRLLLLFSSREAGIAPRIEIHHDVGLQDDAA